MSDTRYDVVFHGEILDGFDLQDVKASFAKLFALTEAKVEQIFSAENVTLKPDLEEAIAKKYQLALERVGANVAIVAQASSVDAEASVAVTADSATFGADEGNRRTLPFSFAGDGGEYFKIWIVNIFLSIITLGIYSAWAKVRNKRYFYGNTQLDGSSFEYLADPVKILKGRIIAVVFFLLYSASGSFSPVLAGILGLLMFVLLPWMVVRSLMFNARNSAYRNIRFNFHGDIIGAIKAFIGWPLLGVLTLGILMPLALYKQQQYMADNHSYGTTDFEFHVGLRDYYMIFLMLLGLGFVGGLVAAALGTLTPVLAGLAMLVVYLYLFAFFSVKMKNLVYNNINLAQHGFHSFMALNSFAMLFFTNTLATVLTVGLFTPWAKVRTANYVAEHLNFEADGDLDRFIADEQEQVSALGEEIGDVFDFDIGF